MLNIIKLLEDNLNKETPIKSLDNKDIPKVYLFPSEAMTYTPSGEPLGACIRQVWFNKKNAPVTNPRESYNNFIFEAGRVWEDWLVDQYKQTNIYLDRNIKLVDNALSISCEIDILHINPETGETEITECKQYNGSNYYAAKELLGSKHVLPKPKDQNLLQCVKYLMVSKRYGINKVNLVYLDRSCGSFYNNKQFTIYLQGDKIYYDTFFSGELVTIEVTEFDINSISEKDKALIQMIDLDVAPPPDYFISYNKESLELDYKRGNISKTAYTKIIKGEENIEDHGSWLCKYCSFSKNKLTGESTCIDYIG